MWSCDSDELSLRLSRNGRKRPPQQPSASWAERFQGFRGRSGFQAQSQAQMVVFIRMEACSKLWAQVVCTLTSGLPTPSGVDDLEGTAWLMNDAPRCQYLVGGRTWEENSVTYWKRRPQSAYVEFDVVVFAAKIPTEVSCDVEVLRSLSPVKLDLFLSLSSSPNCQSSQ